MKSQRLVSAGDFTVDIDTALLHLQFGGLEWKLKRIDLRPDLLASATSAGAGNSISPLLSPVVDTYLERGEAQGEKGDWKGAIAEYTQVLAIDPKSSAAYAARGSARQSQNDLDGAIADYTQAMTIDSAQMAVAYNDRG